VLSVWGPWFGVEPLGLGVGVNQVVIRVQCLVFGVHGLGLSPRGEGLRVMKKKKVRGWGRPGGQHAEARHIVNVLHCDLHTHTPHFGITREWIIHRPYGLQYRWDKGGFLQYEDEAVLHCDLV